MYSLTKQWLFNKDAETAHDLVSNWLQKFGRLPIAPSLLQSFTEVQHPRLEQTLFHLTFRNPIGLAAGMDKTGQRLPAWQAFGFGFLEAGGFTYKPQPGNPKPRMFRLEKDRAIINRMGFNNPGAEQGARNLARVKPRLNVPLFINMGKGKDTPLEEAPKEYADILECLWPYGDAFVINVSSPNTLNLRALQGKEFFEHVVEAVQARAHRMPLRRGQEPKAILVKIAPDLSDAELDDVISVGRKRRISGFIATNTTVGREGLTENTAEVGGLSGPPLFPKALEKVRYIHSHAPEIPVIATGGIRDIHTLWQMRCAGARLFQIYTALVYEGPGLVRTILEKLLAQLEGTNATISKM